MRTAINAEKWIDANKFETPNGYYWVTPRTKSEKFDSISFYQGSPGVIVFYLELYNSTKEKLYLEKANYFEMEYKNIHQIQKNLYDPTKNKNYEF